MSSTGSVLYIGGLRHGGNGPDWLQAIAAQGFSVTPFDTKAYGARASRLEQALARRTGIGRHISQLNRDLCALAARTEFDFAIVLKGVHVQAGTVQRIAERASLGAVLHVTPDSMFIDNRSRHFLASVPHYSALFSDKRFEQADYEAAGARKLAFFDQPYGLRFEAEEAIVAARADVPASDVCFIGHCQNHYVAALRAVAEMGVDLKIWGPGWPALARRAPWARDCVMGDGLWAAHYPAALSRAKIGLGLLSKRIPEEATTRSAEIPAAGTFLLAERTPRHKAMYLEGVQAAYFDNFDEMLEKISHYLADDAARIRIAAAGTSHARSTFGMRETVRRILVESGMLLTQSRLDRARTEA